MRRPEQRFDYNSYYKQEIKKLVRSTAGKIVLVGALSLAVGAAFVEFVGEGQTEIDELKRTGGYTVVKAEATDNNYVVKIDPRLKTYGMNPAVAIKNSLNEVAKQSNCAKLDPTYSGQENILLVTAQCSNKS